MPLLDHFHEPLDPRAAWESFHHRWAVAIADGLDQSLPAGLFARVEIHLGPQVAADVAEFESREGFDGGSVALKTYTPPAADITIPRTLFDETEVQVRSANDERLLAVIELVSPANKASPRARAAFVKKVAA